jgi:hypothetical protein
LSRLDIHWARFMIDWPATKNRAEQADLEQPLDLV